MTLDPAKWPKPVTLAYLVDKQGLLGIHCHK
jgi:hypothetical protein